MAFHDNPLSNSKIIDINEEEREFLERVCFRAERLAWLNNDTMNLQKVLVLGNKLKELNKEITKDDN